MEFRFKKKGKHWIVEYKKYRWSLFGLRSKWAHATSWAGMSDKPFYYRSAEDAVDGALREIKNEMNFAFTHGKNNVF